MSALLTQNSVVPEVSRVAGPPTLQVIHRKSDDAHSLTDNPQRRCANLTKLRKRFSWSPTVSLREGLRRTVDSYRESPCASQ
jgi:UDP-glucuronate decarboxylase